MEFHLCFNDHRVYAFGKDELIIPDMNEMTGHERNPFF